MMPGGIDGLGQTRGPQEPTPTQAPLQPVTVQANGQTIEVQPSISSLVQDAQEETTVLLQEKASTTLSRREAKSKSSNRLAEIAQKYLQKVWDVDQVQKFQQAMESLKKLGNPTPQQVRQQLQDLIQQSGGEGSETGLLLAMEEALAAEGGNEELLSAVRQAKSDLGTELQEFYKENVRTYEDVGDVYKQLLGEYGQQDFLKATEMMIHRLGDDLQSQRSNSDKALVKATVDSLYNLEVARNTYVAFSNLVTKMQSQFGVFQSAA